MPLPGTKRSAAWVLLVLVGTPLQAAVADSGEPASFEGVWTTPWCDPSRPGSECGGFTAWLVQDHDRLCGRFGAVRPGLTQIDEGNPRSIRGVVVEVVAVAAATSGRNEGTYLVRLNREGAALRWRLLEQVGAPDNGDIQLLALDDVLARTARASDREQLAAVRAECLGSQR